MLGRSGTSSVSNHHQNGMTTTNNSSNNITNAVEGSSETNSSLPTTNYDNQNSTPLTTTVYPFTPDSSMTGTHPLKIEAKQTTTRRDSDPLTPLPSDASSSPLHMYNKIIFEDASYLYRTVTITDLPALKKLQQELFPVQYNKQFYLKLLDKSKTYTLLSFNKENNELIGVCSCSILSEEVDEGFWKGLFGYPEKYYICYIMTLGVKKSHRRKGLASRMLQILEEVISAEPYHCTKLVLHCKVDNQHALSFYNQNAFIIKQKIDDYYNFGSHMESAYKLEKDLTFADKNVKEEYSIRSYFPASFSGILTSESKTCIHDNHTEGGMRSTITPSTLNCLTLSFQLWKFMFDSIKLFTMETYHSMSNLISSHPIHLQNTQSQNSSTLTNNSSNFSSTNNPIVSSSLASRPRIVIQIQEQECE